MKRMMLFGMAVALLAAAGSASAYPSHLGPSGGTNLPDAFVVTPGDFNLAIDHYDQGFGDVDAAVPVRLLYGVSPNFEIGGSFTKQDIDDPILEPVDLDTWGINGKYSSMIRGSNAAWAVGAVHSQFMDDELGDGFTQLYWVGSKVLNPGNRTAPKIRGSLGVNFTSFDTFITGDEDSVRPFVALDMVFPNRLTINAELQFKDDDVESDSMSAITLRYPFTESFSGQIGFNNGFRGVLGTNDHDLTVGVNFAFSGAR